MILPLALAQFIASYAATNMNVAITAIAKDLSTTVSGVQTAITLFARRHPQRWLIIAGFLVSAIGLILLLILVRAHAGIWRWIPGLLLFGGGVGTMLTSSVNVVQSSFPDQDQGEISGLSRSVSNLGSSLGTALVGSVLVAVKLPEGKPFAVALTMMADLSRLSRVKAVATPAVACVAGKMNHPAGMIRARPGSP
jgi:MFS family permease